jgi:hypothetical protein
MFSAFTIPVTHSPPLRTIKYPAAEQRGIKPQENKIRSAVLGSGLQRHFLNPALQYAFYGKMAANSLDYENSPTVFIWLQMSGVVIPMTGIMRLMATAGAIPKKRRSYEDLGRVHTMQSDTNNRRINKSM